LGSYSLSQIINVDESQIKLPAIENRILEECNQQAQRQYGVAVVDVGIRRISYPTIVTEAVYNRMKAEREKEAKKYRAEGEEAAAEIEADTDKEVSRILAEAYKQSEIVKGDGDSEAIRIYGEAYGKGKEFYDFLGSLEAYKKILGPETTLILSTDSELFRYLVPRLKEESNPQSKIEQ
jgi:membrane protease subunit HflC